MSNKRACTRVDTTGRLDDLALAFRSGVRALAMSESHVRKVIDSAAVLWSIRLRIWGSEVRSSGRPAKACSVPFQYHERALVSAGYGFATAPATAAQGDGAQATDA